ncbi:TadE/TadG family type IV pilus assembly protein [Pseudomonas purpurea]|uniref:TadE/TadG family type IV pilus assembly protein n=1 Tax=Pseudomonas purpurea TaxID=3136737 RepID=UPI003262E4F4
MKAGLRRKQKGAAAIEFALVFVIFFAVFYGLVSYSLPLLMMQSFNESTAEAVRRSVAVDPTTTGYKNTIETLSITVLKQQLSWIPTALQFNADTDATALYANGVLSVTINYPSSKLYQVLPRLVLPGIGAVPNLPTLLTAKSSLQF